MVDEPEQYTLKDKKAIDLWLAGKNKWNEWVEKHPDANVDFRGVDFGEHRDKCDGGYILFEEYIFPNGDVSFYGAQFSGAGDVSFRNAQFSGDSDVSFSEAEFSGDGFVSFY
ncbi:MAG: pentapeptide repeat-containing protein, partial [Rhizobiales bacterium]|nr:pentapeptide repeat-containing protein [Hyphomicrobiales bacterium]